MYGPPLLLFIVLLFATTAQPQTGGITRIAIPFEADWIRGNGTSAIAFAGELHQDDGPRYSRMVHVDLVRGRVVADRTFKSRMLLPEMIGDRVVLAESDGQQLFSLGLPGLETVTNRPERAYHVFPFTNGLGFVKGLSPLPRLLRADTLTEVAMPFGQAAAGSHFQILPDRLIFGKQVLSHDGRSILQPFISPEFLTLRMFDSEDMEYAAKRRFQWLANVESMPGGSNHHMDHPTRPILVRWQRPHLRVEDHTGQVLHTWTFPESLGQDSPPCIDEDRVYAMAGTNLCIMPIPPELSPRIRLPLHASLDAYTRVVTASETLRVPLGLNGGTPPYKVESSSWSTAFIKVSTNALSISGPALLRHTLRAVSLDFARPGFSQSGPLRTATNQRWIAGYRDQVATPHRHLTGTDASGIPIQVSVFLRVTDAQGQALMLHRIFFLQVPEADLLAAWERRQERRAESGAYVQSLSGMDLTKLRAEHDKWASRNNALRAQLQTRAAEGRLPLAWKRLLNLR